MKILAIVGAGPGLGLALAKTFGQHDFRVARLSRRKAQLDEYVQQLREWQIEAAGFQADVLHAAQVEGALARVIETFGPVDVLEYSPTPTMKENYS